MLPYYNPIMQGNYLQELNNMRDRIDAQIQQAQQVPQPTNLTQNFQLAPNNPNNFKLVNNIEDVQKEMVIVDSYFLARDNSTLWVKNARGDIKTFLLEEVIQKDEKDIMIENLQRQIDELKGSMSNEYIKHNVKPTSTTNGNEIAETKSTNVPITTTSKTK